MRQFTNLKRLNSLKGGRIFKLKHGQVTVMGDMEYFCTIGLGIPDFLNVDNSTVANHVGISNKFVWSY